jgi:hypothetical protein
LAGEYLRNIHLSLPMASPKACSKALRAANILEKDIFNADGSVKQERFNFHCLRHGFCSAPDSV